MPCKFSNRMDGGIYYYYVLCTMYNIIETAETKAKNLRYFIWDVSLKILTSNIRMCVTGK